MSPCHFGLTRNNISSYEKSNANPPIEDNIDSEPDTPAYKKVKREDLTDFLKLIDVVAELTEEVRELKDRVQDLEERG